MAIQKIKNSLIYCLSGDTKPSTYADNTLAYEQDTGDVYKSTSGSWSIISGASKTETFINKTIDSEVNTIKHVMQPSVRRFGYWIPGGASLSASGMLSASTPNGTVAFVYDATEGVTTSFSSTTSSGSSGNITQALASAIGTGRRAINVANVLSFKTRIKSNTSATSTRFYVGFFDNSSTAPSLGDTPLTTTQNGVIVGYSSTDTNFTIYTNNGAGSAATKTLVTGPIAKDTSWHTIEIIYNGTVDVTVIFDGTSQTVSTALPASSANQYAILYIETATTAARAFLVKYGHVEAA